VFPVCDKTLPAADLDALPVERLVNTLLALFAAEGLVDFVAILVLSIKTNRLVSAIFACPRSAFLNTEQVVTSLRLGYTLVNQQPLAVRECH
jgi:hypothetical protein